MNRYERTRALVEGDSSLASELALEVEHELGAAAIDVLDEPREELVMVKVRETAQGTVFYLGEALMTSCRVEVAGAVGLGMALGSKRCLARDLAVVDAVLSGPLKERFALRWEGPLRRADQVRRARLERRGSLAERTKVDFDTLKVDM